MTETLQQFLLEKGYTKVKLKLTKTNHFEVKATINGVKGVFILDTGASSSCVGFEQIDYFKLTAKDSKTKAAGAGRIGMETKIALNNSLIFKDNSNNKKWKNNNFSLVIFDLTHVNKALTEHKAKPVNGIIGADVLKRGKAIIDYKNNKLYLKRVIFKW
jgi:hypothetical protein